MVVVHKETTKEIMKILLDMDGILLNRGDTDNSEEEIIYFKRMAECCSGDLCLPVIISLRNGKMKDSIQKTAADEGIPVISFTQECVDAVVITYQVQKTSESNFHLSAKEHVFDIKTPWARKRVKNTDVSRKTDQNEIESIEELRYLSNFSFDVLVCYLLIGAKEE
ncbi:uncharacterized protein LOC134261512 [Saccostrea cucullata]|uniref:uncharacterized protein LOC134261512 n=1 Tax=Saccostrea cuccullata TaxID=36930 RepID=UPI002ED334EF